MALENFEQFHFDVNGTSRPIYRRGAGPAVILVHELPGITPEAIALARRLASAGFTVFMPSLKEVRPAAWALH